MLCIYVSVAGVLCAYKGAVSQFVRVNAVVCGFEIAQPGWYASFRLATVTSPCRKHINTEVEFRLAKPAGWRSDRPILGCRLHASTLQAQQRRLNGRVLSARCCYFRCMHRCFIVKDSVWRRHCICHLNCAMKASFRHNSTFSFCGASQYA